jgi:hypothetical protein
MARKAKRSRKLEPAVTRLSFTAPATGTNWIDLSFVASALNRRFYRQGLNWAVGGFRVTVGAGMTGNVTFSKIPQTWTAMNSWKKSFALWNNQQQKAIEEAGAESAVARYRDFKIFLDRDMVTASAAVNFIQDDATTPLTNQLLLPVDNAYNLINTGEWEYSEIEIPNNAGAPGVTQGFYLHMLGDSAVATKPSKGMIAGYQQSRAYPQSPDPAEGDVGAGWMNLMFDVGGNNEELIDNATDKNDNLPYDQEQYPGTTANFEGCEVIGYAGVNAGAGTGVVQSTVAGTNVPCGLIRIDSAITGGTFYDIIIDLVPGPHRGYLCESMRDV